MAGGDPCFRGKCLRPLNSELVSCKNSGENSSDDPTTLAQGKDIYSEGLKLLREKYHNNCLFAREPSFMPKVVRSFDDSGVLHGRFTGSSEHQGYDGRMHGGIIAAIIDSSMAHCLMGHGVVGYTANLSIKYRHPLLVCREATFITRITGINVGVLYSLECEITQNRKVVAEAAARFYKFA